MIKELKNHCEKFLQSLTEVPRNKRELQFLLTSYLKQYYDRVFVDYEVPLNLLAKNDVDIPEKHGDEWTTPASIHGTKMLVRILLLKMILIMQSLV